MKMTTVYTDCIAGIAEIHRKLNDLAYDACECVYQLQRHDGYVVLVRQVCPLPICIKETTEL
jgi:hypothetical protein